MTYRDPAPTLPDCPVCSSNERVRVHDNRYQGRWLAMCCMVLFDDVSAEWVKPTRPPLDAEGLQAARTALEEATR